VVISEPVEDQLQLFSGRGHGTDIAVAAAMRHLVSDRADVAGLRQHFHRFDGRPPHQARALFGDPPAVHRGVGFVVGRRQSGPTGQLGGPREAVHVPDLGDEHRRLAKGGIWVPMTDLFGVEGNLLLDNVTMPAPYKERIASLRRFIEGFDAEIDLFTGLVQRRLSHDAGYNRDPADPRHRARAGCRAVSVSFRAL